MNVHTDMGIQAQQRRGGGGPLFIAITLVVGTLVVLYVWWWLPRERINTLHTNYRTASSTLKSLATIQAEFRANDSDANGVQDFWTGDVAGLLRFGLIGRAPAEADPLPIVPLVPKPIPFHGYYFVAMQFDDTDDPEIVDLRLDTDGKSGKVHHRTRFAICAYPAVYGVTGKTSFILNEDNSMRMNSSDTGPVLRYPSNHDLRHEWALGD